MRARSAAGSDFYIRKDFDPKVGLTVVIIGALISAVFYWFGEDLIAYSILGGAALIDLVVYGRLGDVPSATDATPSSAASTSELPLTSISIPPTCSNRNTNEKSAGGRTPSRSRPCNAVVNVANPEVEPCGTRMKSRVRPKKSKVGRSRRLAT